LNAEPFCKADGHSRGWHVELLIPPLDPTVDDRFQRVLQCKHPAHGSAGVICGPEADCFPEVAQLRASISKSSAANGANASTNVGAL